MENQNLSKKDIAPVGIYRKLHSIMGEIEKIDKDKRNTFHNYNYASEFAIKKAVHEQLVLAGVLFQLSATNIRRTEITLKEGKRSAITDIDFNYSFTDIENGETISGTFVGSGEDNLDKGTYKAITGAIKYILTSVFLIPTGDDPENENGNGAKPATAATNGHAPEQEKKYPEDNRPWLTEKQFDNAVSRILQGEKEVFEKTTKAFKMKKEYKAKLSETLNSVK